MPIISSKQLLTAWFVCIFICAGCSSQNPQTNNITTPDFKSISAKSTQTPAHSIHAIYNVYVDTLTQSIEITPLRQSDLDLHVNLNPYLLSAPCRDCLRLDAVGFDDDEQLLLDFGLTHAFQDPAIRPDLNGFDIRGIIALPATRTFPLTPYTKAVFDPDTHLMIRDSQQISLNPGAVVNADGYTPLWDVFTDMPEFAENIPGTLNPFIDYFREDNPDPVIEGNLIPWRTFAVGAGWDFKRYILDLTKLDQVFEFYFIADVSYGQAATWKTRQNPFYRNPQFNIKEAYEVTVDMDSDLVTGEVLSTCDLTITVKDWQAGAPLVIDPLNPGQSEIDAKSDVAQITIDTPDLQFGLIALDTPDSGTGTDLDPWIYTAQIRNLKAATTGFYPVLIGIEDDLNATDELDLRTFELVFAEVRSSHVVIEFNPPERVTNNSHASFIWPKECIALDAGNKPHVVWTDDRTGYHQVYYSYRASNGEWSAPENISQSDGQAFYCTLAIDSDNHGHIVWEDTEGLVEGMNIHYGFKTSVGLDHNVNLTNFSETISGFFPKVSVDSSNEPHIVWSENSVSGENDYDVKYMHLDLTGPTPTPDFSAFIGQTTTWEGQPTIALYSDGTPRVAFIRDEGTHKLYFSKKSGSSFSDPSIIYQGPAYWPDMEYSTNNIATVAFHGGGMPVSQIMITYSFTDGVNWEPVTYVSSADTLHQLIPDIAYDSFGTVHIIWHELDIDSQIPGQINYAQFTNGVLTDVQPITPDGFPSAFPSIAIDKNNDAHVAVQSFFDDNYEIFYLTSKD